MTCISISEIENVLNKTNGKDLHSFFEEQINNIFANDSWELFISSREYVHINDKNLNLNVSYPMSFAYELSDKLQLQNYPGVYLIAYQQPNHNSQRIINIGMTHGGEGLKTRLGKNFVKGLNTGHGHAEADRLHKLINAEVIMNQNIEYSKKLMKLLRNDFVREIIFSNPLKLYVKFLAIERSNELKNPVNLKINGIVRALEYFLFARYFSEINEKPILNEQYF